MILTEQKMNIIEKITDQGMAHKNNEDICGHTGNSVWIFDGATGLSQDQLVAPQGKTDPRWLVETAHDSLKQHAGRISDLHHLYAAVLGDCEDAFEAQKKRAPNAPYELPMAASLILHYNGTTVTCGALSDCSMIIETEKGLQVMSPCSAHAQIDTTTKVKMIEAIESGLSPEDARAHLIPHLQENRKLANCDGGYDVFAPTRGLEDKIRIEVFSPAINGHALMMTDGFYALVENYDAYTDQSLIEAVKSKGLRKLLEELRQIEEDDKGILKFPRFKKSDDATAILLKF